VDAIAKDRPQAGARDRAGMSAVSAVEVRTREVDTAAILVVAALAVAPLDLALVGSLTAADLLACWLLLLIVRRERFEAPHFFWPLLAYAGVTLFSAVLSSDVRTSLVDCKQLVLFLVVPVANRFVGRSRAPMLMTVILTCAAVSAAYGIVQYGILHYDYLGHRPQGTLGHYMTYSGLLMLVIAIAIARVLFGRGERTWAALVIPALTVAVKVTTVAAGVPVATGAFMITAVVIPASI
jgi:hypothetical protein